MVQATQVELWCAELDRLSELLNRVGPDEVCCEGLTPRQTAILRTLSEREGARLSDLAAAARITPSAMTRVVEKLEIRGLVQRVRGTQQDGRAAMVRITPHGRKARQRVDELIREQTESVVNSIPAEQREAALLGLQALVRACAACCGGSAQANFIQIEREKTKEKR